MNWIKLTTPDEKVVFVNLDRIQSMTLVNSCTYLNDSVDNGNSIAVKETPEEILLRHSKQKSDDPWV